MLAFLDWYRGRAGQSSLVRRFASIKCFYGWLIAVGARSDNPCDGIRLAQPREAPKRPFSEDDLRTLLTACRRPQERAIVLLLIDTGLRLSEIVAVRRRDLGDDGVLRVRAAKEGDDRLAALGTAAEAALRSCMDGRDFPWYSQRLHGPMTLDGFYRLVRRLGRRAGLANVHPHRFRTTFACMFIEQTQGDAGSAQVLMGHKKLETTLRYASWTKEKRALEQQRRVGLADRLAG